VKIPLNIKFPSQLIRLAKKLGKLSINGRDMSVRFPEAVNTAIEGKTLVTIVGPLEKTVVK